MAVRVYSGKYSIRPQLLQSIVLLLRGGDVELPLVLDELLLSYLQLPLLVVVLYLQLLDQLLGLFQQFFLPGGLRLLSLEQPRPAVDLGLQVAGMAAQPVQLSKYRGRTWHRHLLNDE